MRARLLRALDSVTTVYAACALTLALGLVFVFVWAPHPWGWQGIDQYHELARALARGEPFGTTDVPWGYAYYVAAVYAAFGEQPWITVTLQAVINAALPMLLFHLVRPLAGQRVAVASALITGVFSFNTVYASTQSTDSICTVLFIAALVAFAKAARTERWGWFALAGALLGLVPQFRPNLILFPAVAAALYVAWPPRGVRKAAHATTMLLFMTLVLSPWIVRNYRLTGLFLPTSTHGGVQLWYGTLQVGPYLENRAANPREAFETPSFPYTSIVERPVVIRAEGLTCPSSETANATLVVWTDRDPTEHRLPPRNRNGTVFVFEVPPQPAPTVLYYYLEGTWPDDEQVYTEPLRGRADPSVYFISTDHLGDLDVHGDLLDVFDVIRMIRAAAWAEPIADPRWDFVHDGRIDSADLRIALAELVLEKDAKSSLVDVHLATNTTSAVLRLPDGSTLEVPREWTAQVTDVTVAGRMARELLYAHRSWPSVSHETPQPPPGTSCRWFDEVAVNDVFYRAEVHAMRRYTALAIDNIRRDPVAFLTASAYRMVRLFVVRGSDDPDAVQQFRLSGVVYAIAGVASAAYFVLFLVGVVIAARSERRLLLLLVPILYVPLTICFVLTNMRYTITMQPLVFSFIATALVAALSRRNPD
jgi:hypothetical protein